jgi:hypothetical protein
MERVLARKQIHDRVNTVAISYCLDNLASAEIGSAHLHTGNDSATRIGYCSRNRSAIQLRGQQARKQQAEKEYLKHRTNIVPHVCFSQTQINEILTYGDFVMLPK